MADMKTLYDICERLSEELKEISREQEKKDTMTAGDLENIDKLTHALKSVKTVIAMEEAGDYSNYHPYSYDGMSYADGMNGNSYARGRTGSVRRDSMGRYSRESRRGYSRDGAHEEMVGELREMMNEAKDTRTKDMFQRFISELENN